MYLVRNLLIINSCSDAVVGDHAKGPVLKPRLRQTLVVKQEFHCQILGNRCEFQWSLEMMT